MAINDPSNTSAVSAHYNPLPPLPHPAHPKPQVGSTANTYAAHFAPMGIWSDVYAQNNVGYFRNSSDSDAAGRHIPIAATIRPAVLRRPVLIPPNSD